MNFNIPEETLEYWQETGIDPASEAEILGLEKRLGGKAPKGYVEFMLTYGSVSFTDDINSCFSYVPVSFSDAESKFQAISFIKSPSKALRYYDGLVNDPEIRLPSHLLPFGMDYGQGELLIEFGQPTERIFYWDFNAYEPEKPLKLNFVSDTIYDFINNLVPFE